VNILDLALIKELTNLGIELNTIQEILRGTSTALIRNKEIRLPKLGPWQVASIFIRKGIKDIFLALSRDHDSGKWGWIYDSGKSYHVWPGGFVSFRGFSHIVISLRILINYLEDKTGESLVSSIPKVPNVKLQDLGIMKP
jgi:hypothetical protein